MYQTSEKKTVEDPVVRFAQRHGVLVLKINPMWSAGWPDRLFIFPGGRVLFIEFKRPGGKLRPKQEEIINKLRGYGHEVEVIDSVEQGQVAIRSRLEAVCVHEARDAVDPGAPRVRIVPRSRSAKD